MTLKEWTDTFGDNLSELLVERGMTQHDLAMDSGLSAGSINAYIRKQSPPGIKAIINIAYALDVSVDELVDFGDRIE
jgi:transcriptional regulator with XRE-family HTH domain